MSPSPAVIWLVIGVSGVLTFALRAVFILRRPPPEKDESSTPPLPAWLQVIAPAALGALVLPAVVRPEGNWSPFGPEAGAALVAAVIAWRTRSTAWTILVGFASLLALQALGRA